MRITSALRAALLAAAALAAMTTASLADSGTVRLKIIKAGFIIGGNGGTGVMNFHGQNYGLAVGGIDYGLVFGGSETFLHGTVSHISQPSDIAGVYAAAGAGLAIGGGARAIVLTNEKGAVLKLSGKELGLLANADLSGLAITLK